MYNRYVPQPDGSFCRSRIPDAPEKPAHRPAPPPKPPERCEPERSEPERCEQEPCEKPAPCPNKKHPQQQENPLGFLQRLLPKNFDTGDLIVILLLLLLAGDCEEDRSTALLTLALYFVM
jgi:hypothetical protein